MRALRLCSKMAKDEARFVVVTGFFRSKERAKTTIARLGLPAEVVVTPTPVAVAQFTAQKIQALIHRI
jgi:hypothetical protein